MDFILKPIAPQSHPKPLLGAITPPGDKSVSHRALILGALTEGKTLIRHGLISQDTLATKTILQACGVSFEEKAPNEMTVHGLGLRGLNPPSQLLDCGNSGTTMRLLCGLFSPQPFPVVLTGDESLSQRPMGRVVDPLNQMGANIRGQAGDFPPLKITPAQKKLRAMEYTLPMASAQVKSALLLAGLYAEGETVIHQPIACRDHTERMLKYLGWPIRFDEQTVSLHPGGTLQAKPIEVPGDLSSAAFFLVAGSIIPGSHITLNQVGVNPGRTGIIALLKKMGGNLSICHEKKFGEEPVAHITVTFSPLRGTTISPEEVPAAIDEFPALFIAAGCAEGGTILRGAGELRQKESDRLAAMAEGLIQLGVEVELFEDGLCIHGRGPISEERFDPPFSGGTIHSRGDHRIAMAFAVAGCLASGEVRLLQCDNVATSYPNFIHHAKALGFPIHVT